MSEKANDEQMSGAERASDVSSSVQRTTKAKLNARALRAERSKQCDHKNERARERMNGWLCNLSVDFKQFLPTVHPPHNGQIDYEIDA